MTASEARKALTNVQRQGYGGVVARSGAAHYVIVSRYGNVVTEIWEESDVTSFVFGCAAGAR